MPGMATESRQIDRILGGIAADLDISSQVTFMALVIVLLSLLLLLLTMMMLLLLEAAVVVVVLVLLLVDANIAKPLCIWSPDLSRCVEEDQGL